MLQGRGPFWSHLWPVGSLLVGDRVVVAKSKVARDDDPVKDEGQEEANDFGREAQVRIDQRQKTG